MNFSQRLFPIPLRKFTNRPIKPRIFTNNRKINKIIKTIKKHEQTKQTRDDNILFYSIMTGTGLAVYGGFKLIYS